MNMLDIKDLHAGIGGTEILKGLSLCVNAGEVHAIMGPNGSGKSTLAQVVAGHPDYSIQKGSIRFRDKDLTELEAEERAREGLFLGFQYPVEIAGVNNAYLLKAAVKRVAAPNTPVPFAPAMEKFYVPQVDDIVAAAVNVVEK